MLSSIEEYTGSNIRVARPAEARTPPTSCINHPLSVRILAHNHYSITIHLTNPGKQPPDGDVGANEAPFALYAHAKHTLLIGSPGGFRYGEV